MKVSELKVLAFKIPWVRAKYLSSRVDLPSSWLWGSYIFDDEILKYNIDG